MVMPYFYFLGYLYHFNGNFEKQKFLPWSFITIFLTFDVELPPTIRGGITIFQNYGKEKLLRSVFALTKIWWAW
jgi:hypothetical protein